MYKKRPTNLNLLTIRFPLPAIVSILHRASGFVLFLFIPFLLWGLTESLSSPDRFNELRAILAQPVCKFFIWTILAAFIYHFIAGIRHLLMDMHMGDNLKGGRLSSFLTLLISGALMFIVGCWLW